MDRNPVGFRQRRGGGGDGGEDWITTYADAITLLMAFFVMMFSVSTLDAGKYENVREAIITQVSQRPPAETPITGPTPFKGFLPQINVLSSVPSPESVPQEKRDSASSESNAEDTEGSALSELAQEGMVSVERNDEGVVVEFASASLFESGSGDLRPEVQAALQEVSEALLSGEFKSVDVEGHTDDIPIKTARFPSNWELSTSRATSVVRFFIDQGVPADRLRASGFADTRPKDSTDEADETLLSESEIRARNRRVVIRADR